MTGPHDSLPVDAEAEELDVVLTKAVYAVEGVTDVFAPTTIAQVPQIVAALVTGEPERLNRVTVTTTGDATAIDARIGVDSGASAALAARAAADALLGLAATDGEVTVSVQVSRIS